MESPASDPVLISVVIATRNRRLSLARCLHSLRASVVPDDVGAEVVVVDNGSSDETGDVVRDLERQGGRLSVRYLFEGRQGKTFAVNAGVAVARGRLLAFTDDDVAVDASWIAEVAGEFQRDPELALLAGRVVLGERESARVAVTAAREPQDLSPARPIQGLVLGSNLAVRREVLVTVGGRDTRLGPGRGLSCEDIDFVYRVLRAGFRGRFSPLPVVHHFPGPRDRGTEYLRGWGALYLKFLLRGDRYMARQAWWDARRLWREARAGRRSGTHSPGEEVRQMAIGAAIMARRMLTSPAPARARAGGR
jgi:GT2 family glycosyltransferase